MTYAISGVYCLVGCRQVWWLRDMADWSKVLEWILLVLVYAVVAVRIYMSRFRFRENLHIADYLLIVSALNTLALVIWDTVAHQTVALDGKVRSEILSKVSLDMTVCFLQICTSFTRQNYYGISLLTSTDPACMFALYWSLVAFEGRRMMWSTLLATSLLVAEDTYMYEFFLLFTFNIRTSYGSSLALEYCCGKKKLVWRKNCDIGNFDNILRYLRWPWIIILTTTMVAYCLLLLLLYLYSHYFSFESWNLPENTSLCHPESRLFFERRYYLTKLCMYIIGFVRWSQLVMLQVVIVEQWRTSTEVD